MPWVPSFVLGSRWDLRAGREYHEGGRVPIGVGQSYWDDGLLPEGYSGSSDSRSWQVGQAGKAWWSCVGTKNAPQRALTA